MVNGRLPPAAADLGTEPKAVTVRRSISARLSLLSSAWGREQDVAGELAGRRIVVPESRELDLFVDILERQGAVAIRCPLVTIHDPEDPAPAEAWLRRLLAGRFDDLVLYTGEGVRRLLAAAERAGMGGDAVAALARPRRIVRGPKPTRALRDIGLAPDLTAPVATSAGLLHVLASLDLAGRTVGMQAYPGQPDELDRFIEEKGGTVDRVLPYRYASDREDEAVADAIRAMATGGVDLVAFTSRPQVVRLREVAERYGLRAELGIAMERVRIAAVGPVTAEAVVREGWTVAVAPAESFHLKPFVAAMRQLFAAGA